MRSSGRNSRDSGSQDYRGAGGSPSRPKGGGERDGRQQGAGRPRPEERRYDTGASADRDRSRDGDRDRPQGRGGDRSQSREGDRNRGGDRDRPQGRGGDRDRPQGRGGDRDRPQSRDSDRSRDRGRDRTGGRGAAPGKPVGGGRGAAARGGAKGGPKSAAGARSGGGPRGHGPANGAPGRGSRPQPPARPREFEAQIEERNRARHSTPQVQTPKTFGEQEGERLQKVLARAGMGSRRACEELIDQRRVEVNGKIVVEQGLRVDPQHDEVKVDGLTVATQSYLFFALNKPAGVVSTMEDPDGRQCLGDYVTNRETRLFHVGRLDTETEGLILLTNHGELAHRLTHPRYGVKKTYLAAIQGPIPRDLGKQLKNGIQLEDGYARADHFRVVENTGKNYLVEVSLHEGRKHIVRRMLAEAGFPVDRLVRTHFGPIPLGDQKSGWLRRLTNTEVGMLMREVEL